MNRLCLVVDNAPGFLQNAYDVYDALNDIQDVENVLSH